MSVAATGPKGVDEYIHGVLVRDPYRWLEDRELPETEAWIREQQRHCDEYFAECEDFASIRETVESYLDVETVDQPARIGNRYFFRRRDRGQEQGCIYVREGVSGEPRLLLRPPDEDAFASVGIYRISSDGKLLAYDLKIGGEDRRSIGIVDVETGNSLGVVLPHGIARGFTFMPMNEGFIYSHVASRDSEEWVIRQQLFSVNDKGITLFVVPRNPRGRLVLCSDAVHLGAIHVHEHVDELVVDFWVANREHPTEWKQVIRNAHLPCVPWLQDGRIFVLTRNASDTNEVIELSLNGTLLGSVIRDRERKSRQFFPSGTFICSYLRRDDASDIQVCALDGGAQEIEGLPQGGTIRILPTLGDGHSIFLSFESFTQRRLLYEYVPVRRSLQLWCGLPLDPVDDFASIRRVTYPSKDGTEIPMTLVGWHDPNSRESRPVLMTSYGGFGVSSTPQFSVLVSMAMKYGFLFALPHIRGGGDLGREWHDAGRGRRKQTSFDDFIMAGRWLIEQGIAAPGNLAAFGGSNSGLLVAVAATQAPNLFKAILCIAPLLDMVRYETFGDAAKWSVEFGSYRDPDEFASLLAYSPYHAIREGTSYPSILFVTGDRDERCDPAHVRKTAARLLEQLHDSHVIVDYQEHRGHSPTMPLEVRVNALARRLAFISRELGVSIERNGGNQ